MPLNITKKLGQHFLINQSAIQTIVAALELKKDETIIEIGPGEGALTLPLAEECQKIGCKLIGIEKDQLLVNKLISLKVTNKFNDLEIVCEDALKKLPEITKNYKLKTESWKIVGNIPYYITGKLMRVLSELEIKPSSIVLTIQKEVAERIVAKPPKNNLLAAATQFWAEPEIIGYLKPNDFSPPPQVKSAIIKLTTRTQSIANSDNYYKLVKILFRQPRKTIFNNLRSGLTLSKEKIEEKLKKIGLPGQERPQNLTIQNIKDLI